MKDCIINITQEKIKEINIFRHVIAFLSLYKIATCEFTISSGLDKTLFTIGSRQNMGSNLGMWVFFA